MMSVARSIQRQIASTLVTTLAIQIATFVTLALAPLILQTEAFARLSVIVAVTMLANAFFDLGLNLTSTKFHSERGEDWPFFSAFRVRLTCIPLAAGIWALFSLSELPIEFGAGIFYGAVMNLWNGIRTTDQARQDYLSFARASVLFAALRLVCGLGALLLTHDPVITALGLYVLPVLAGFASRTWPLVAGAFSGAAQPPGPMLRYAFYVYINTLIFVGLPYVPQLLIAQRLDPVATGTYGLIVTFTAPFSLVVYSLRSVLLPKMLGGDRSLETAMWSARGAAAVSGIALLSSIGGVLIGFSLEQVYGMRFPDIRNTFAIFFAGFSITAIVGIYSLSIHTLGVPGVAMWTALTKAVVLAGLLELYGNSLSSVVAITSAVMVFGELVLILLLAQKKLKGA